MPTHWGATLGLLTGGILTAKQTIKAWREGWDVADTFQSCFTGWSLVKGDFDMSRMVFTIPAAVGGAATWVAIKTGYNAWTPKGANI